MSSVSIFICFLIVLASSLIFGILMHDNNNGFLKSLLFIFMIITIVFATSYTDEQNKKIEKYGTYPDTTITIKNGVRDTTIIYKMYEEKNN